MWGKVRLSAAVMLNERFNPTHVGKRLSLPLTAFYVAVQPHACGEKRGMD